MLQLALVGPQRVRGRAALVRQHAQILVDERCESRLDGSLQRRAHAGSFFGCEWTRKSLARSGFVSACVSGSDSGINSTASAFAWARG